MKECFLIASYCDTQDKLNVLCETVENLKKHNIDICIYATFPLPSSIQKSVEYYIYDSDNAIVNRKVYIYKATIHRTLSVENDDYGLAVLHQFKRGSLFLSKMYDTVHFVNYDAGFTDNFFKENSRYLIDNNGVFYYKNGLVPYFFSVKPNNILEFFDKINLENYLSMRSDWVMEEYLDQLISNEQYNIVKITSESVMDATNNLIEGFDLYQKISLNLFYILKFDAFRIFIGQRMVQNLPFGLFEILIYNISENISIEINIGDESITCFKKGGVASNLIQGDVVGNMNFESFETHLTYDNFVSLYEKNEASIKINNIEILNDIVVKGIQNAKIIYV